MMLEDFNNFSFCPPVQKAVTVFYAAPVCALMQSHLNPQPML